MVANARVPSWNFQRRRILETVSVGDNFEILVTDSSQRKGHQHNDSVTNFKSPTSVYDKLCIPEA